MRNLKFSLGVLLVFCLILTGCGQNTREVLDYNDLPPTFQDVDPEVLMVNEQMASEVGGFYLKRGDTLYTMSASIPEMIDGIEYGNIGIETETTVGTGRAFYGYYVAGLTITSIGDVPIPALREGDQVIYYPGSESSTLELYRVRFSEYAPCFYYAGGDFRAFCMDGSVVKYFSVDEYEEDVEIYNEAGEEISEPNLGLSYGDRCYIAWHQDDQEYQVEVEIDSCRYIAYNTVVGQTDPNYTFEEGNWSEDEAYMVYDLSDVPPGLYLAKESESYIGGLIVVV